MNLPLLFLNRQNSQVSYIVVLVNNNINNNNITNIASVGGAFKSTQKVRYVFNDSKLSFTYFTILLCTVFLKYTRNREMQFRYAYEIKYIRRILSCTIFFTWQFGLVFITIY